MTIEEYLKENPDWDINMEYELGFVEPDNSEEARINIEWVLNNSVCLSALSTVVKSYYGGVIEWESF